MGMTKRQALQIEMTAWIRSLDADEKTDLLLYLCAAATRDMQRAKAYCERLGVGAQGEDPEGD